MNVKSSFKISVTMISNDFIDKFMAAANGEYIKEYLFLMRHEGEEVTISMIADELNHTEADVARALTYWKKAGVLTGGAPLKAEPSEAALEVVDPNPKEAYIKKQLSSERTLYSPEKIGELSEDKDFSQLLYIAQKYMNMVFTQRECEVFAYLYDGLSMPLELLEYVVEYCVQAGHPRIRYIEKVAIDWHKKGICSVEEAKNKVVLFSKDYYGVMRAFGISDRNPGYFEKDFMDRWFFTYGFNREIVIEACNRTLAAIHTPKFSYADKILEAWKKAGVRTIEEIKRLEEGHVEQNKNQEIKNENQPPYKKTATKSKTGQNQFQNFPQREIDYDALILDQLTEM